MNLTLSIPYDQLTVRGRYLPAEVETSDKPAVPEVYEIESVVGKFEHDRGLCVTVQRVELVDHLTPESLTEIERRKLDEIRAEIERAKEESAA